MQVKHNLNKIADEIALESYTRGWNDAFNAITAAARSVGKRHTHDNSRPVNSVAKAFRKPRQGSDAWHVLKMIENQEGLTGVQIVEALKQSGNPIKERTVRTALHRLRGKYIEQRDGETWHVIQ